ncbi:MULTISPECIES: DUF1173 family protein [unclassified Tsukamurella]|uniref:DUF1173 family protein n=1 Tax=unclassified Tsukamurella TaxID=2633480 RepID=UPI0031BAF3D8
MLFVGGVRIDETTDAATRRMVLASAYEVQTRPECGCRPAGHRPAMYIAQVGEQWVVKRMPNTGNDHAVGCDSWSPPPALSGAGEVLGRAVVPDRDGSTALRLGFAMSRAAGRAAPPAAAGSPGSSVKADGTRLSLRGLLHLLWDEARLTVWSPRMTGRRSWRVVSWHLGVAAEGKTARGVPLRLWVPEPFRADDKAAIAARRTAAWSAAVETPGRVSRFMVLVGEVKKIERGRYGHLMTIKHLPGCPVVLDEDLHKRMVRRFDDDLELWGADPQSHLVVAATFSVGRTGLPRAHELTLMLTTPEWLPVEGALARDVVAAAVAGERRFTVSLRYNRPAADPHAVLVLTDVVPPVAVTAPGSVGLAEAVVGSDVRVWEWDGVGTVSLPGPSAPDCGAAAAGGAGS